MAFDLKSPVLKRSLAVLGSSVVLVVGFDYVTYAATGSSLILGVHNVATSPTFITNNGAGAPLVLVAHSAGYPPFATNARGMVVNLNAQFLGGRTLAQVEATSVALAVPKLVWHPLVLINGWGNYFSTPHRAPAYAVDAQGVVHFRGGISTGGNNYAFTILPAALRPSNTVYLTADTFGGTTGRIIIYSDGSAHTQDPSGTASLGFTSLEGITYALG